MIDRFAARASRVARMALAALATLSAAALAAPPTYRVTPLTDGTTPLSCWALNAGGDLAGTANTRPRADYGYDAVLVAHGKVRSYGVSHGRSAAEASGLNAGRVVVGNLVDPVFGFRSPVAWQADGRLVRLPTWGSVGYANGVNDAGDIVGSADAQPSGNEHAAMWIGGQIVDLAPDHDFSAAYAVDARRRAVGQADGRPVMFADGQVLPLGSLGGTSGSARAIDATGRIVGDAALAGNARAHAFLYDGTMHDLGSLPGQGSAAYGINASGVVVGLATGAGALEPAALAWFDGTPVRLDTLLDPASGRGWTLAMATAVNDAGQICASGNKGGALLTPLP